MSSTTVTPGPPLLLAPTGQPMPLQAGEFVGSAPPNELTFGLQHVPPPTPLYIQRDDQIGIRAASSQATETVVISGRFLRVHDGVIIPFTQRFPVSSIIPGLFTSFALGEGYLLSLTVGCQVATFRGITFVCAFIARGTVTGSPINGATQVLVQDYVTLNQPTGWPGGRIIESMEGPGFPQTVNITTPGAGTDFSSGVFNNQQTRLYAAVATLTTSATVASRNVLFRFHIGGAQAAVGALVSVPASTVVTFYLMSGGATYTDAGGNQHLTLPNAGLQWFSNGGLNSLTANIQAGDQWSAISMDVEQLLAIT